MENYKERRTCERLSYAVLIERVNHEILCRLVCPLWRHSEADSSADIFSRLPFSHNFPDTEEQKFPAVYLQIVIVGKMGGVHFHCVIESRWPQKWKTFFQLGLCQGENARTQTNKQTNKQQNKSINQWWAPACMEFK